MLNISLVLFYNEYDEVYVHNNQQKKQIHTRNFHLC